MDEKIKIVFISENLQGSNALAGDAPAPIPLL
jgi:hypothetical protein